MSLTFENALLVLSVMIFISIAAGLVGYRLGVPSLLILIGVGMLMGSGGVGYVYDNYRQAQFIGIAALSVILFSGGMDTRLSDIKPVWREGVVLATAGVVLTALFTGAFIYAFSSLFGNGFTFAESLLLASVMASTDSASVFSILRSKGLNLTQNLRPLLELESGSNDPMAYLLVVMLIAYIKEGVVGSAFLGTFALQMALGFAGGVILGKIAVFAASKIKLDSVSLYSIYFFSCVLFIYSFTDKLGGNGYLAVYMAGLTVGNSPIPNKRGVRGFFTTFTWLWQILMFMTLGLLVNPDELLPVAAIGLSVGVFMMLVGRPLSVFLCLAPFRKFSTAARVYVSWVGLRGAVPIIFATYPVIAQVEHANVMFNVVFFITIMSLVIQGGSVVASARLLGLGKKLEERPPDFGIELPDEIKSVTSEIKVDSNMLAEGRTLRDLNLPEHTLVVMVKRSGKYFIPRGSTEFQIGDSLLLISDDPEGMKKVYDKLGVSELELGR